MYLRVRNRWGSLLLVLIQDATPSEARAHRHAAAGRLPRATLAARALPRESASQPRDPITIKAEAGGPSAAYGREREALAVPTPADAPPLGRRREPPGSKERRHADERIRRKHACATRGGCRLPRPR